jgi:CDGSH-type Zn-finger protein
LSAKKNARIKVSKDGPYLVTGDVPVVKEVVVRGKDKMPEKWKKVGTYPEHETCALCRCGRSENAPYCDSSHARTRFEGTETCGHRTYDEEATLLRGGAIDLTDARGLCMGAQFCHRGGGIRKLVAESNDKSKKELAIEVAGQCPSGRLVACEKDGTPIEPSFEKSISATEDPDKGTSGPLWVKGGITIESADGREYEERNRVTLCRCGRSENKPLCDGTHNDIRFKAKDKTL